jgi:hypothetical protein
VIEDEMQDRNLRTTHEGGHAAAAHLLGHRIKEIRVDPQDDGVRGWVEFERPTEVSNARVWWREHATISRIGALVTNMDWLSKDCAGDRRNVRKIAIVYLDVEPDVFEDVVKIYAEELVADSRFDVAHRAISRELLDHVHEVMPGEVAHRIMDDALWCNIVDVNGDYSLRVAN